MKISRELIDQLLKHQLRLHEPSIWIYHYHNDIFEVGDFIDQENEINLHEEDINAYFLKTDLPRLKINFEKSLKTKQGFSFLYEHNQISYEAWVEPRLDDHKNVLFYAMGCNVSVCNASIESMKSYDMLISEFLLASSDMIFIIDEQGIIVQYFASSEEKLYVAPEVFLNHKVNDVLPKEIGDQFIKAAETSLTDNISTQFEYHLLMHGKTEYYSCRISVMEGTQNVMAIVRNITAVKENEFILKSSRDQARAMIDNAPFPILISRLKDRTFIYANQRARERFGLSENEGIGLPAYNFYRHEKDKERVIDMIRTKGRVSDIPLELLDYQGNYYDALLSAHIITFDNEPSLMISLNDISELKNLTKALEKEHNMLNERIKEQQSLQKIFEISDDLTKDFQLMMQQSLDIIRDGMQYPKFARIRMVFGQYEVMHEGYQESLHGLQIDKHIADDLYAKINCVYVNVPDPKQVVFFEEEKRLFDQILTRFSDVFDRKEKLNHLNEQNEFINTMFNQAKDSIVLVDPADASFVNFNDTACSDLGYTRDEFQQLHVSDIQGDHDDQTIRDKIIRVINGERMIFETFHKKKDGSIQNARVNLSLIQLRGKPLLSVVWQDITEYKAAEKIQIQRTKMLDNFLSIIASFHRDMDAIDGHVEKFIPKFNKAMINGLNATNSDVFLFDDDHKIHIVTDHTEYRHLRLDEIHYEEYISQINENGFIVIHNIEKEEKLKEIYDAYFSHFDIHSLLCLAINVGRDKKGFVIIQSAQTHPDWIQDQINFALQASDHLGRVILNHERLRSIRDAKKSTFLMNRAQSVSGTGHWIVNLADFTLDVSDQFYHMLNVPVGSKLTFEDYAKFVHPDDLESVKEQWNRFMEGEPYFSIHRLVTGEGIKYVENRVVLLQNDNEDIKEALGTTQDITERVKIENELQSYRENLEDMIYERTQELEKARQEAIDASQSKSQFLSNMSHEIRTPMNAIVGYTHLLRREDLNQHQLDYLNKIENASNHLLELVNDILDISKIEANKIVIEKHMFEPSRVIDAIVDYVENTAKNKNLLIDVDLDHIPLKLIGDSVRVKQILLNLMSNAVKFTEAGTVKLSAEIVENQNDNVRIRFKVSDTGIGLTDDQKKRLFQEFEQADTSITRRFGGTGLGLAISKRLAELMHGSLNVESEYMVGSTFVLEVPFQKVKEEDSLPNISQLKNQRVLVCDDNDNAREILSEMLKRFGFIVDVTENAQQAIDAVLHQDQIGNPYQLILMDWKLPDLNGIDAISTIRSYELNLPPTVMLVTGYSDELNSKITKKVGISAVLYKPVTPSKLFDLISDIYRDNQHIIAQMVSESTQSIAFEQAKVLVVEDNLVNQEIITELLKDYQITPMIANHGEEAIQLAKQYQYDLILMDIQMPIMDGITATKLIRKIEGYSNIPILAMTANAFSEHHKIHRDAGMNDQITKPIHPSELKRALMLWLPNQMIHHVANEKKNTSQAIIEKLHQIENIDIERALELLENNVDLYIKLLRLFLENHKADANRMKDAMNHQDEVTLSRIIHTLKGTAGTLGLSKIQELAIQCENHKKNDWFDEKRIDRLIYEINQISHALERSFLDLNDSVKVKPNAIPFDQVILDQVEKMLEKHDIDVEHTISEHVEMFKVLIGESFSKFVKAMEQFEYKQALDILKKAKK